MYVETIDGYTSRRGIVFAAEIGTGMLEEATCRQYVVPRLEAAGWAVDGVHTYTEQDVFTDGRIIVAGGIATRQTKKRTDYLLRYTRDFPIAVVEAKRDYKLPGEGMQQAKDYADLLDLPFAYSTNGHGVVEFDRFTGREVERDTFPTPDELWERYREGRKLAEGQAVQLLTPSNLTNGKFPRYYQVIAINRAIEAILRGQQRLLLTMATGTGKTTVAFQICWKLWSAKWTRTGRVGKPKILFLADRNILVDDPYAKDFAPFGDARHKIEGGKTIKSREMYFAIYQAIAEDEAREGLFRSYPPDFFDLIVIDECHRGSARDDSSWRAILDYFRPAVQLGMTATPLRDENRDTYDYFGAPLYTYSLRQGIADGFLAPYSVHRIVTTYDATGWRPEAGELDRHGEEIPDAEYHTKDFERRVVLTARTEAIARHLTDYLHKTDRFAKTLVFCVDQEHADTMRRALNNLNTDLVRTYPDYVCRVTANEGDIGRGHLSTFQDVETRTPVILTTSQLLTTGVDAPTVKNVVLMRVVGAMTEFKQIIGRGTRVREDYDKLSFAILDYTGSATQHFADPDFDGDPVRVTVETIDDAGETVPGSVVEVTDEEGAQPEQSEQQGEPEATGTEDAVNPPPPSTDEPHRRPKYYVDHGTAGIAATVVYELDANGKRLRTVAYTDYAGEGVRTLFATPDAMRESWADREGRAYLMSALREQGIDIASLVAVTGQPDADPFDILCHLAWGAPLHTRRERAERVRTRYHDQHDQYAPKARAVLDAILDKYTAYGPDQLAVPDILSVPPIPDFGNAIEIAKLFGGPKALRTAVDTLVAHLYDI